MFKGNNPYLNKTLGTFSIKDIEAITGIKSHTLRIWEQRYGMVVPKRSDTNIRFYDDHDLKSLLNISLLNEHGYKISEIAKLTAQEIAEKVIQLGQVDTEFRYQIRSFIAAMMAFDEAGFHKLLHTYVLQFGMEETFLRIVFPFLQEVGMLWQVGSITPSHEHFASHIIKQKLYVAIDAQVGRTQNQGKKFLLFLPETEKHSLGMLFANYAVRSRGHQVLYLGQEVPLADLLDAFGNEYPDFVVTLMTAAQPEIDKQQFVEFLSKNWPASAILLTGSQFNHLEMQMPANVYQVKSMDMFLKFLDALPVQENPLSLIA